MKSCLKIKYSAIKWNNQQGAVGCVFFAETLLKPFEGSKIDDLTPMVEDRLKQLETQYVGEVSLISITVMEIFESTYTAKG